MEEVEEVILDEEDPTKVIQVGKNLPPTKLVMLCSVGPYGNQEMMWCGGL